MLDYIDPSQRRWGRRYGRRQQCTESRPRPGRRDRPRLCHAKQYRCRSARGVDCDGASHAQRPRNERSGALGGSVDAGGADPAIGPARPCRVPRMRVSRPDTAPASARGAWTSNRRHIAPAGSCQPITRSPRRSMPSGVRRWQRTSGSVAKRRKPPLHHRLLKWSRRPRSGVAANRDRQSRCSSLAIVHRARQTPRRHRPLPSPRNRALSTP